MQVEASGEAKVAGPAAAPAPCAAAGDVEDPGAGFGALAGLAARPEPPHPTTTNAAPKAAH